MQVTDLTVEVREASLERVGQVLPDDLVGFEFVTRFNSVGSWRISLRDGHPLVDQLRAPGAGIIVSDKTGVLISGPTTSATLDQTGEDPKGVWSVEGADDNVLLGYRLAYPDPSTDDVSSQGNFDVRSGPAETVFKEYVDANMGPSAPASRQLPNLVIAPDTGKGPQVVGRGRYQLIGELLENISRVTNLGFRIAQIGSNLEFQVYETSDQSSLVRLDVENRRLDSSSFLYSKPTATRVLVGGAGDGEDRIIVEATSSDSVTAETIWNTRIEAFKDKRDAEDPAELTQAGQELLQESGSTIQSIEIRPSDDISMRYAFDWNLGDLVTVVVGSVEIVQVVTEAAVRVDADGVRVGATVGQPDVPRENEDKLAQASENHESRISNLERNTTGGEGGASPAGAGAPTGSILLWSTLTAPEDWLICDGTAVSRSSFSDLFGVIGTTYGAGDGSSTFNLPNFQGRVPVGLSSENDFDELGKTGGEKSHTLTVDEMPSHTHVQDQHNHTQNNHNHTQNAHTHTQNAHTHTQNAHNHGASTDTRGGLPQGNFHGTGSATVFFTTQGGMQGLGQRSQYRSGGGNIGGSQSFDGFRHDWRHAHSVSVSNTTATNQNTTATNRNTTATNNPATATNNPATATNQNTGGGQAHNNLQPYMTVNYIIKA